MKRMPTPVPDSSVPSIGKLLETSQPELLENTCRVIQRDSLRALRPQALSVFRKTATEGVFRSCGYAVLQLGSPLEYYDVVLGRLTEGGEVAAASLDALLNVFDETTGGGGRTTIPANEARRLADRWRGFVDNHRQDLEARRKLSLDDPDATADLVPEGWSLDRNGKPRWPAR